MQRLGKNHGGYYGETIGIRSVLDNIGRYASQHGWTSEKFHQTAEFEWLAWRRNAASPDPNGKPRRIYISTGIHGDEPAGPLAAERLLREDLWPADAEIQLCPCLNPTGFLLNQRENREGIDLNRDYRNSKTPEILAHIEWLERQPAFDLYLCLHEDWESRGFYVYEQNPEQQPSLAHKITAAVERVCPIDLSDVIEGRAARDGVIRANIKVLERPDWPEAFYLISRKSRLGYTLEAPSDFPLEARVAALVEGVGAALGMARSSVSPHY